MKNNSETSDSPKHVISTPMITGSVRDKSNNCQRSSIFFFSLDESMLLIPFQLLSCTRLNFTENPHKKIVPGTSPSQAIENVTVCKDYCC